MPLEISWVCLIGDFFSPYVELLASRLFTVSAMTFAVALFLQCFSLLCYFFNVFRCCAVSATLFAVLLFLLQRVRYNRDILIDADCVQHMQADVFPIKITEIDCKYYFKNVRVLVLPP